MKRTTLVNTDTEHENTSKVDKVDKYAMSKKLKVFSDDETSSTNTSFEREENPLSYSTEIESSQYKEKLLNRDISNFEELPQKSGNNIRIISYNIGVDFFDNRDTTEKEIHKWKSRSSLCKELIERVNPDVFCLQELSPDQAFEFYEHFKNSYHAKFLSQTPSEIQAGEVANGPEVQQWIGKNVGTALLGTFFPHHWNIKNEGCFWLNESPDEVPTSKDRGNIDKGFGNMNTYRAVFYNRFEMECQKNELDSNGENTSFYVFNSHYPLNGDSSTRHGCADLEMNKIKEMVGISPWVSVGDRNLIPNPKDHILNCPQFAYQAFVKDAKDARDSGNHYGISTTWIGFTYERDGIRNEVKKNDDTNIADFVDNTVLDLIVSNMPSELSFHLHGAFTVDNGTPELLPLTGELHETFNGDRRVTSDHALIGADFDLNEF